jgi:hypothetical protein
MLLGFAFITAGVGLAFLWPQEFFYALKGALILGLMLLGLINLLIALSKQRAKRTFAAALKDDLGEENATNTSTNTSTPPV